MSLVHDEQCLNNPSFAKISVSTCLIYVGSLKYYTPTSKRKVELEPEFSKKKFLSSAVLCVLYKVKQGYLEKHLYGFWFSSHLR